MKLVRIIVSLLTIFGILCGFIACAWAESYPRTFFVEAIDPDTDTVLLYDMNGWQWEWEGVEDWAVEDMAAAIMDDNGTPENIFDDIIITLHYQTNISDWDEPDEVWEE